MLPQAHYKPPVSHLFIISAHLALRADYLTVGWELTIDQYFEVFVESIYDTVIAALAVNPERKFIAVEMAFFAKWWEIADVEQKITAKRVRVVFITSHLRR